MSRGCGISLSGKPNKGRVNGLAGTNNTYAAFNAGIVEIKTRIIDAVILPYMSQNWKTMEENLFLLDIFRRDIDAYAIRHPSADICVYKDLIGIIESSFTQQMEINELEKRLYENQGDASALVVKLDTIRLKPELELYNLILGKPDYTKGGTYDDTIVQDIARMMKTPRASFSNIKKYIHYHYHCSSF